MIDASDSAVQYGSGWQDMRDIGNMTLQNGAKQSTLVVSIFPFWDIKQTYNPLVVVGTSLKWFPLIPNDEPLASTSATYSVDGGTPVTFFLSGLAAGALDEYNQFFFEVLGLGAGQHRIEVVHGGNSQTTPLSLNYVVIQNAPAPAGSTLSALPSGGFSSSSAAEHKGASTGAIASGVVVLAAVIFFLLLLRRRRKRNDIDHELNQEKSSPNIIEPFSGPPTAPISFSASGRLLSYFPVLSGPSPGGKIEHLRQYLSQSTAPTGPGPSRFHNSKYLSSQASRLLATPGDAWKFDLSITWYLG